ncbi:hypothetical protein [Ensifer canadensis]
MRGSPSAGGPLRRRASPTLFERYGTDAERIAAFVAAAPDAPLPHA